MLLTTATGYPADVAVVHELKVQSVTEQKYMFHGAIFPALVNIAVEGFDLSACLGKIFVSDRR